MSEHQPDIDASGDSDEDASLSIVYVLTNSAMPGLVKIGWTDKNDPKTRVSQLYTTGVPVPFSIEYACRVSNPVEVEKALHIAFAPHRINKKREFFEIEPEQAIVILKLLNAEDATTEVAKQSDGIESADKEAAENLLKKRQNFNFKDMGIPVDAVLSSTSNDDTVEVVDHKRVRYNGEEMSFTMATRLSLDLDVKQPVRPAPYWKFGNKTIAEIYEDTYLYE